ncbi:DUF480 domain-containing protein [Planctomicrobium sp. SH668]|uniref:DUF480 domain-containing protein n=1 Tax=Planctomicrobium sp. SH668 TaxID=3448126 RepID=UPI003F5B9C82
MSEFDTDLEGSALAPVRELSKPQRRVLGTLVEKAFTVPESYPMTLKGLTVGCNQKSNRDPVTNYTEDGVFDALEELRKIGLVAEVRSDSSRTERYRHYTRKRFPFTEPQLAIMTELLLRGRQQLGELRARASRMVPIESLDQLRSEIESLISQNYVRADGSLERRGVEVDHNFYLASENVQMTPRSNSEAATEKTSERVTSHAVSETSQRQIEALTENQQLLQAEIHELRGELEELKDSLAQLKQSLGA